VRIGIVIPAFNAASWIGDAIASVLAQTHRDWRLVVVDDGSTDRTADVVAAFVDRRIRLIQQANAGVSAARNRGFFSSWPGLARPSTSDDVPEAVLFLDADDRLAPDALSRLTATLAAAPHAVAAAGAYTFEDTGVVRMPPSGDILRRLLVGNVFANCGHLLIRAEAFRTAGGFLTDLTFGEDWEFCIRLALQGPFAATADRSPVLFIRQHDAGAYRRLAGDPKSFAPCMAAIFANPALIGRLGVRRLAAIRRRTEAENAWIVGRELVRHGRVCAGIAWLCRSFRAAPGVKRAALLAAAPLRIGPFAPYAEPGRTSFACNDPISPCGRKMMNTTSRLP
jgi:glycosyltransferase involved in cell wall biosynthesis